MAEAPKGLIIRLIREYFHAHPKQEFKHAPIVEWVREQVVNESFDPPGDVPRTVRKLHEQGELVKIKRGVFMYDPDHKHEVELLVFSQKVREAIFNRDNYSCVQCGQGRENGVDIAVDHKIAKSKGGEATVENGQTLCEKHNNMKKNYNQTEAGKRFVTETYKTAVEIQDEKMIAFCISIFDAYDEHDMNGHIERPDRND